MLFPRTAILAMICVAPFVFSCANSSPKPSTTNNTTVDAGLRDLGEGDYHQAIQEFTKALQLRPYDPEILHHRGLAQMLKGDYPAAVEDLSNGTVPGVAITFFYRGMAHFVQGGTYEAKWYVGDFEEAMRLEPHSAYYSVWLYVARRLNYQQAALARGKLIVPEDGVWPSVLIRYIQGTATEQDVHAEIQRGKPAEIAARECLADVMLGQLDLIYERTDSAAVRFRNADSVCPKDAIERAVAQAELKQ
jgi:lipoprotein NlpI